VLIPSCQDLPPIVSEPVRPTELWVAPSEINRRPSRAIMVGAWALDRLREAGIAVPSQNRLSAAVELLREYNVPGRQLAANQASILLRLGDAQRTIAQQALIVRHLVHGRQITGELAGKLATMLTGATAESSDRNPIGRNTEFELYIATLISLGGMAVRFDEPDVVFPYDGAEVGIAAKRLTSAKQLGKRCREAADQIRRSRRRGFIALSADVLVRELTPREPTDEDRPVYKRLVAPLIKLEESLARKDYLLGTILIANSQHWSFSGVRPKYWTKELQRHWPFARSDHDLEVFSEFAAYMTVGSQRAERTLYPE
jgi:hypothetical protein